MPCKTKSVSYYKRLLFGSKFDDYFLRQTNWEHFYNRHKNLDIFSVPTSQLQYERYTIPRSRFKRKTIILLFSIETH